MRTREGVRNASFLENFAYVLNGKFLIELISYQCSHLCFPLFCSILQYFSKLQSTGKQQKQTPKVFYKKGCSKKFRNIHRKTPVLESLFNKVAKLKACRLATYLKRDYNTGAFL